jgi:hypothetical protein
VLHTFLLYRCSELDSFLDQGYHAWDCTKFRRSPFGVRIDDRPFRLDDVLFGSVSSRGCLSMPGIAMEGYATVFTLHFGTTLLKVHRNDSPEDNLSNARDAASFTKDPDWVEPWDCAHQLALCSTDTYIMRPNTHYSLVHITGSYSAHHYVYLYRLMERTSQALTLQHFVGDDAIAGRASTHTSNQARLQRERMVHCFLSDLRTYPNAILGASDSRTAALRAQPRQLGFLLTTVVYADFLGRATEQKRSWRYPFDGGDSPLSTSYIAGPCPAKDGLDVHYRREAFAAAAQICQILARPKYKVAWEEVDDAFEAFIDTYIDYLEYLDWSKGDKELRDRYYNAMVELKWYVSAPNLTLADIQAKTRFRQPDLESEEEWDTETPESKKRKLDCM